MKRGLGIWLWIIALGKLIPMLLNGNSDSTDLLQMLLLLLAGYFLFREDK